MSSAAEAKNTEVTPPPATEGKFIGSAMTQPQEQKPDLGLLTSAFTSETPPSPMPFSGDPVSAVQGSFDFVEFKIQMLKGVLQEDSPLINRHRINIECVLAYYQNGGKLPARGTIRWMVDGKMSETEPTFPTTAAVWTDSAPEYQFGYLS